MFVILIRHSDVADALVTGASNLQKDRRNAERGELPPDKASAHSKAHHLRVGLASGRWLESG
jgi:hypothetical protein